MEDGFVKPEGEVESAFERSSATNAVKYLTGVRSVSNLITVKPKVTAQEPEKKIQTLSKNREKTFFDLYSQK